MVGFIKQWVVNIVALALFIVIVEMLVPTGEIKKFIRLVTGTILVIAIISPLTELYGKGIDIGGLQMSNSMDLDKLQIEKESKLLEEEQMKQTVEVYRQKITEQIELAAMEDEKVKEARADIIFNEDYNSKDFGEIKRIYLEVDSEEEGAAPEAEKAGKAEETGETEEAGKTEKTEKTGKDEETEEARDGSAGEAGDGVVKINEIEKIGTVKIGAAEAPGTGGGDPDPETKKRLTDKISQIFGIKDENIIISEIAG